MESMLFNPRTVKKLVSGTKISAKQKRAAEEWLGLLKEGKLEKEKQGYPSFIKLILGDLLGYDLTLGSLVHEEKLIDFPFKDKSGKIFVCFEAKGTKTEDLWGSQHRTEKTRETPVKQISDYMYLHRIPYGVLTNYRTFALFDRSEGYSRYHKFDFCSIRENPEKLKEFVAIFSRENIEGGFVEKLSEASKVEERNFTKEFYKLFHETRLMMLKEFQENGISREEALHYAQLYLNRLMFVFFAEDTDKLSERLFEKMVTDALKMETLLSDRSNYVSATISDLFRRMNEGSETPVKIFGFNGGLFRKEIPQMVYFRDFRDGKFFSDVYKNSTLKKDVELNEAEKPIFAKYQNRLNPIIKNLLILASFDFKTEVNVNILGHIFEQSLSDLEELKDGKVSKRKKDGIFYTPEYITDYICRNTIIPYLSKKEAKTAKELVKEYSSDISALEEKFRRIKILDPACGSGAFLIKAVDVLLEVSKEIQEFKQKRGDYFAEGTSRAMKGKQVKGLGQLALVGGKSKWDEEDEAREIIQNNIFGVDLNEESVEITKLSLFLKIAKKNKKLISLDKNIKCGNSLIDDPSVDSKAFKWEEEFSEIMSKGGFDVVIGNPPYVRATTLDKNHKGFLKSYFDCANEQFDLYYLFYEKSYNLLQPEGYFGYINPIGFLNNKSGGELRHLLLENTQIHQIIDVSLDNVFKEASTYPILLIFSKTKNLGNKIKIGNIETMRFPKQMTSSPTQQELLSETEAAIPLKITGEEKQIIKKIENNGVSLSKLTYIYRGMQINKIKLVSTPNSGKLPTYPAVHLRDINRWQSSPSSTYAIHDDDVAGAEKRKLFQEEKILIPRFVLSFQATYDKGNYILDNIYILNPIESPIQLKYTLIILNSNAMGYYYLKKYSQTHVGGGYFAINGEQLSKLPIPEIPPSEQKPFIEKADKMLKLNKEFYEKKGKFLDRVAQNLKIEKMPKKLENFHELAFSEFLAELAKKKVKLTLKEQDEWSDYFEGYKKELTGLKQEIEKTDREIDQMVYKLYGLTEEEIRIVEGGLKK
jgi:hypothetical protein